MPIRFSIATLILFSLGVANASTLKIPFKVITKPAPMIVASCTANSQPFMCEIDTGAGPSIIQKSSFTDKCSHASNIKTKDLAGATHFSSIQVNDFRIGSAQYASKNFQVVPFAPQPILLGMDTFENKVVVLDFDQSAVIQISKFPELAAGDGTGSFVDIGDRLHRAKGFVTARFAKQTGTVLLDSGASSSVVDASVVAANPSAFKFIRQDEMVGPGGRKIPIKTYRIQAIDLGGWIARNVEVSAGNISGLIPHHDLKAILGMNVLTKGNWIFDLQNNRWAVYPRSK